MTLFYRHFLELIREGHIYIAQPPLYRVQKGKEVDYVYNEEALDKLKKKYGIVDADLVVEETDETVEKNEEEKGAVKKAGAKEKRQEKKG